MNGDLRRTLGVLGVIVLGGVLVLALEMLMVIVLLGGVLVLAGRLF